MRLWDYAAQAYGREDVRAACLALQDDHGQCVSLLLWRAWTLSEGRRVTPADQQAIIDLARRWDAAVIAPLRSARRALRSAPPKIDAVGLHEAAAAVELAAERALIEAMERLTLAATDATSLEADALDDLARAWRPGAPASAIARLADALSAA